MSELDLEERVTTTLGRMADRVPPSDGDVADVRHRVVRRRRSVAATLCTLFAVGAVVAYVVAEYGSDFTPTQQPLATVTATSPVTAPQGFVPLWPGVLPEGATLVEALGGAGAGPGSYGTGLLVRLDDAGHATAVWIRAVPGAAAATPTTVSDADGPSPTAASGTQVTLGDGRVGSYIGLDDRLSLELAVGDVLVSLTGTVSIDDLVSAADSIAVSPDGTVTPRQSGDGAWQVVIPPTSLVGSVEYRVIFELSGERFAVSSSPAPPSIDNPIQQSGPLTVEHTAEGDLWHLAALSLSHRADGTWVLVGSAEPPGLPLDERRSILASMQPATPEQRATFSADGDIGGPPDMPCRSLDESGRYIVQKGDSPNGVAACFGITLQALLEANPGLQFLEGAKLVIPTTTVSSRRDG